MHNSILQAVKEEGIWRALNALRWRRRTYSCICDRGAWWDWLPKCSCSAFSHSATEDTVLKRLKSEFGNEHMDVDPSKVSKNRIP